MGAACKPNIYKMSKYNPPWAPTGPQPARLSTAHTSQNADNWFDTQRGKDHKRKYGMRFAFDLSTEGRRSRKRLRRDKSCRNFVNSAVCPHPNSAIVMRQDGPWRFKDLEPGTRINEIKADTSPNGARLPSWLRYTCDEFPPATFIQGGHGIANLAYDKSETRCAAQRCASSRQTGGTVIKAEQDWQGTSHQILRNTLLGIANGRPTDFPWLGPRPKQGIIFFELRYDNSIPGPKNSQPAKVIHYKGNTAAPVTRIVSMTKRDLAAKKGNRTISQEQLENEAFWRWADNVTVKELLELGPAHVSEKIVVANHTESSMRMGFPGFAMSLPWMYAVPHGTGGEIPEVVSGPPRADHYKLKKRQEALAREVGGNSSVPSAVGSTPLLRSATSADLEHARRLHARRHVQTAASGTFWMEHIARKGAVPFGNEPDYKVFRNVLDYGAKGDGVADDTKAIKEAMNSGKRCGEKCNGSTTKNAIVYFPPGTYRVSSTISMPFGTQVIGDASNLPTLLAAHDFIGLGVLAANIYTGGGEGTDGLDQQWYVNTANFYRQIRNIKIDITATRPTSSVAGLHYQIAQATSLQNVEIIALPGTAQLGIFAENGSGGVISDVTIRGGKFGLYAGEQQFTAQRLKFIGCDTGVQVIWDWGWVWKSITMTDVGVGFRLLPESKPTANRQDQQPNGNVGSASFIDSTFTNVQTAILIAPPDKKPGTGSTGVVVENVKFEGVSKAVADTNNTTLLAASGVVSHWALGPVYREKGPDFSMGGKIGTYRRNQDLLDGNGAYFERAKPQYEWRPTGDFMHVKDFGARGDGVTDDTAAFQNALYSSQGSIFFVDAGSYIITGTIIVPIGSKIVGETWSQLVASGPYFSNADDPKIMVQVGHEGNVGDVEMQDLIFTNRGPTAGLILVQWNVRAASPGSAGLWDCHVRIGGSTGTELTSAECPPLFSGVAQGCNAGSLMMHITKRASGYFENMWLWVADHMIDDPDLNDANNTMAMNSIYVARGLLVESVNPTWLYGTSSEHAVYYQYNFHKAENIFAGTIQTESPYYQPTPKPPAPFESAVGKLAGDPDYSCKAGDEFSGCDESWAVIMRECANIFVAGAGLYSWFSTYSQDCISKHECQSVLMLLEDNHAGVRFHNLVTIGAKYMAVMDGKGIKALDYLNAESHPRWSQISVLDVANDGAKAEMLWVDPKIWDMEEPSFTCIPPCLVMIPPWTKATRTVNYPLITVSSNDWSTTITRNPLTITQLNFEPVTLEAGGSSGGKRRKRSAQPFEAFWPKPATTPSWPQVIYMDGDGNAATTGPTVPFPLPPQTIGPDAPAPTAGGSWPKLGILPVQGQEERPLVDHCAWDKTFLPICYDGDLEIHPEMKPMPEDPFSEDDEGSLVICPDNTSQPPPLHEVTATSSSSSSTTTTTAEPTLSRGIPELNKRPYCFNVGQPATNAQLRAAARSFCRDLGREGQVLRNLRALFGSAGNRWTIGRTYNPTSDGGWPISIDTQLTIYPGCEFVVNYNRCEKYMSVPADSCNCEGENGKRGGTIGDRCYEFMVDPNL
ncbi:hypothetical protein, variant [Magnaporthiopsis poae ATCC 64411]|uniref:Rhamnogalacturonase A/B/Epimerase-like pectate lyase domain-containing protein n=1 Tax=Magnaporthiopsis poae (strain ATCC 64411 / 73-15) TaxID=644358 RepID=A0A0C4E1C6_MAGP6|nr:hypothetical protein, variant [Magnaporthiopsis poae ATCC 64411]